MTTVETEWQSAKARSISRRVRPLAFGMPVGTAVEAMRLSGLTELPVLSGTNVVGVASLAMLTDAVSGAKDAAEIKVSPLALLLEEPGAWRNLHSGMFIASVDAPLSDIEAHFVSRPEAQIVPVIEPASGYFGVVTRFDVVAARLKTLAPPRVGGMATPLGVYLTDGVHRGGAGDLGLVLSGAVLGGLGLLANLIVLGAVDMASRKLHFDPYTYIRAHYGATGGRFGEEAGSLAVLPVMMLLLRMMPLAGYHAAEHQVVHCIERGELLEPQNVRRMPRVHPRCGTNIAAAVVLFSLAMCAGVIGWQTVVGAVAPAALLTLSFWRPLGSFMQQYFTTRPASEKQIRSGIKAAEELLARYRQDALAVPTVRSRILGTGLLQTLGGVLIVSLLCLAISQFVPALRPYIQSLF